MFFIVFFYSVTIEIFVILNKISIKVYKSFDPIDKDKLRVYIWCFGKVTKYNAWGMLSC